MIDPREIRPGLLLSRCLLSDDNDFSAVQILNISGKPHTLPANLKLGDAGVGQYIYIYIYYEYRTIVHIRNENKKKTKKYTSPQ